MNNGTEQEMDAGELRKFGLSTGAIVAVLFGMVIPWIWDLRYPLWPWIILAVLGGWGLIAPASLHPVYRNWMRFGLLISKITTPIIMGIVFFAVIMPVGVVMRIFGWDPMSRKFDDGLESYRVDSDHISVSTLEKPY